MLSRAFVTKHQVRRNFNDHEENSCRSMSIHEYEEFIIGFKQDVPLVFFDENNDPNHNHGKAVARSCEPRLTLKEVLRASAGVMGESHFGMTEKVVLLKGKICALKRFRKVVMKNSEFGKRIEKFSRVSRGCKQLVPITAYLYSKRIKFVVCDYYPMGSLADLLSGARDLGQTALEWKQRLKIILCIANALAFIHSQNQPQNQIKDHKDIYLNVHGNVKASNIMINIDFTACLSDYGFAQLAEWTEFSDTWQKKSPALEYVYSHELLSQKNDVYNFGIILLDILGRQEMKEEEIENMEFEFIVQGKERTQAFNVLNLALSCINSNQDARPTMKEIVIYLGDILKVRN